MSYKAVVCPLKNVRKHPNADRLLLADCNGYQVVVGKDAKENQLGLFFGPDGQLSTEFAIANDLVQRIDPVTGERTGGYFSTNRRVRSQTFRGEKSYGFWCPLEYLSFTKFPYDTLQEGTAFDNLEGVPICSKYITPKTKATGGGRKTLPAIPMFPKHVETEQLRNLLELPGNGGRVYLSEKLHGTSGRYGYVKRSVPVPQKWYQKLLKIPVKYEEIWVHEVGTRNMVLGDSEKPSYYGTEQFRFDVFTFKDRLRKGEVVYGELVGYTHEKKPIMPPHNTKKNKPEKFNVADSMEYKYGCLPGECKLYVYRIIMANEDGDYVELSDQQMRKRCVELGVEPVPKLFVPPDRRELNPETIEQVFFNSPSVLDPSHIKEGIVIRVDGNDGNTYFIKHKSYLFGLLEGYIKDDDNYVDTEEVS